LESDSKGKTVLTKGNRPIDDLSTFTTATANPLSAAGTGVGTTGTAIPIVSGTRFATRQVLAQEHAKLLSDRSLAARQARFDAGSTSASASAVARASAPASSRLASSTSLPAAVTTEGAKIKRDFFGRPIILSSAGVYGKDGERPGSRGTAQGKGKKASIWVTFHEGFSNAVRKPVSLGDIMGMI
jgi:chromosome transmission fidelity protein 18